MPISIANYLAVAISLAVNLTLIRFKELKHGISVSNKEGDIVYGYSRAAARKSVL